MIHRFSEARFTRLQHVANAVPPRHPNNGGDDDEEDEEENEEEEREPAVIREPDEDK